MTEPNPLPDTTGPITGPNSGDAGPDVAAAVAPTGTLRVAINLGNPVLAQGTSEAPRGVTVDLGRAVADRLGVPVAFVCSDAARHSFEALRDGRVDLAFLADEPARAAEVAFTPAYVLIEGVYAVADASPIRRLDDVDRAGVRIGVKQGSAYDLFLTRTLQAAEPVRGADGVAVFAEQGLEVAAGIRQPVTAWVREHPGHRLVEPRFMEIRQAVAVGRDRPAAALAWLSALVAELIGTGFVSDALARSGQDPTQVAPPPTR